MRTHTHTFRILCTVTLTCPIFKVSRRYKTASGDILSFARVSVRVGCYFRRYKTSGDILSFAFVSARVGCCFRRYKTASDDILSFACVLARVGCCFRRYKTASDDILSFACVSARVGCCFRRYKTASGDILSFACVSVSVGCCFCSVANGLKLMFARPEGGNHTLWKHAEEVQSLQRHSPTCPDSVVS